MAYSCEVTDTEHVDLDQRASGVSVLVALVLWALVIAVLATLTWTRVGAPLAIFVVVLMLFFPALSVIRWIMFRLIVDANGVQVIRTLVFRAQDSLELNKIEGVGIHQGPFGRIFDYGRLTISGVGVRQLRTEPVNQPHEAARLISDLIPRG